MMKLEKELRLYKTAVIIFFAFLLTGGLTVFALGGTSKSLTLSRDKVLAIVSQEPSLVEYVDYTLEEPADEQVVLQGGEEISREAQQETVIHSYRLQRELAEAFDKLTFPHDSVTVQRQALKALEGKYFIDCYGEDELDLPDCSVLLAIDIEYNITAVAVNNGGSAKKLQLVIENEDGSQRTFHELELLQMEVRQESGLEREELAVLEQNMEIERLTTTIMEVEASKTISDVPTVQNYELEEEVQAETEMQLQNEVQPEEETQPGTEVQPKEEVQPENEIHSEPQTQTETQESSPDTTTETEESRTIYDAVAIQSQETQTEKQESGVDLVLPQNGATLLEGIVPLAAGPSGPGSAQTPVTNFSQMKNACGQFNTFCNSNSSQDYYIYVGSSFEFDETIVLNNFRNNLYFVATDLPEKMADGYYFGYHQLQATNKHTRLFEVHTNSASQVSKPPILSFSASGKNSSPLITSSERNSEFDFLLCSLPGTKQKQGIRVVDKNGTSGGPITMQGLFIEFSYDLTYGSGVAFDNSTLAGTNTIRKGELGDCTATDGGAISVKAEQRLLLEKVLIYDSTASNRGGAIFLGADAECELRGCEIGRWVRDSQGNFGGKNTAEGWGGGIYARTGAKVILNDTRIKYNKAQRGGGISLANGASLTDKTDIEGGSVIENNEASVNGGGVYCENNNTVDFNNSSVLSNTAGGNGGGFYMQNDGVVNLTNTTIEYNSSANGAGMHVINRSIINAAGSNVINQIRFNKASGNGGGMYLGGEADVRISNSTLVYIMTNTANKGGGIYTGSAATASVSNTGRLMLTNNSAVNGGGIYTNLNTFTLTNTSGSQLGIHFQNNKAKDGNGSSCNGGGFYVNENATVKIIKANLSGNEAQYGGGGYVNTGGKLDLQSSQFSENTASYSGAGLFLQGTADASLQDVSWAKNKATRDGGAICTNSGEVTVTLNNCEVQENESLIDGGAFNLSRGTVMTVEGTNSVVSNEAKSSGGAISMWGADLILSENAELTMTDNKAMNGGGISANSSTSNDGTIGCTIKLNDSARMMIISEKIDEQYTKSNKATNGGGLHSNTTLTIDTVPTNGGAAGTIDIIGNTAEKGGGMYLEPGANTSFEGPGTTTISGNEAKEGRGMYNAGANLTLSASALQIEENEWWSDEYKKGNGGGLYMAGSGTIITERRGKLIITNHRKEINQGAGVYVAKGSNLTLQNDVTAGDYQGSFNIYKNRALAEGGGVYVGEGGHLIITGRGETRINENESQRSNYAGGGIYLASEAKLTVGPTDNGHNNGHKSLVMERNNAVNGAGGGIAAVGGTEINTTQYAQLEILSNMARPANVTYNYGGGISSDGKVNFAGTVNIEGNHAYKAGGVFLGKGGECLISGNFTSVRNTAVTEGAGFYTDSHPVEISGSMIVENNTAHDYGGMCVLNTTITCTGNGNVRITGNKAQLNESDGGSGGGMGLSNAILQGGTGGITISGNMSKETGGGIYAVGDERSALNGKVDIKENTAPKGAGIYLAGTRLIISDNQTQVNVEGNIAEDGAGGGIAVANNGDKAGSLEVRAPAGLNMKENKAQYGGGIMVEKGSKANLANTVLSDNTATEDGGGIYMTIAESYYGDIYVPENADEYKNLTLASSVSFANNAAKTSYWWDINDTATHNPFEKKLKEVHDSNIDVTVFSTNADDGGVLFNNAFNNQDINARLTAVTDVILRKVNPLNGKAQGIAGVEFGLYQCSSSHTTHGNPGEPGSCWELVDAELKSGQEGLLRLDSLEDGVYALVETAAPITFEVPEGYWILTLVSGKLSVDKSGDIPDVIPLGSKDKDGVTHNLENRTKFTTSDLVVKMSIGDEKTGLHTTPLNSNMKFKATLQGPDSNGPSYIGTAAGGGTDSEFVFAGLPERLPYGKYTLTYTPIDGFSHIKMLSSLEQHGMAAQSGETTTGKLEFEVNDDTAGLEVTVVDAVPLILRKVDIEDYSIRLSNATFVLYSCDEEDHANGTGHSVQAGVTGSCWKEVIRDNSSSTGIVELGRLGAGQYMLSEAVPPKDYAMPFGQWLIQMDETGGFNFKASGGGGMVPAIIDTYASNFGGSADTEARYWVPNTKDIRLPASGITASRELVAGIALFVIVCILFTVVYIIHQERKSRKG